MSSSTTIFMAFAWTVFSVQLVASQHPPQSRHNLYASILQDSRNEPTPDGTFGYHYKTEDGITSVARGDPSGVIHGTFSYTDPTGLKVNYNYNAGARNTPASAPASGPAPARAAAPAPKYYNDPAPVPRGRASQPVYREEPQYYSEPSQDQYDEPVPQYRSRARPVYSEPEDAYQSRRGRPIARENDIYDDYNYRG
uniref:Cuticular protein 11 n=1 Tax=Leptinotarsa decemlineata TaxID=7539 RepID=A0A3Q8HGE2_LEPDE|nr:cuticular protein 11 [Leptinotarsa decemlineata]